MAYVKLQNATAVKVMELTAKLWEKVGGQRPTYDDVIDTVMGNLDEEAIEILVSRYNERHRNGAQTA
jgi:hypothetical protein